MRPSGQHLIASDAALTSPSSVKDGIVHLVTSVFRGVHKPFDLNQVMDMVDDVLPHLPALTIDTPKDLYPFFI
jgi:hypothetical protein